MGWSSSSQLKVLRGKRWRPPREDGLSPDYFWTQAAVSTLPQISSLPYRFVFGNRLWNTGVLLLQKVCPTMVVLFICISNHSTQNPYCTHNTPTPTCAWSSDIPESFIPRYVQAYPVSVPVRVKSQYHFL